MTNTTALPEILNDPSLLCFDVLVNFWPLLQAKDRNKIAEYTCQTWALIAFEKAMDKAMESAGN